MRNEKYGALKYHVICWSLFIFYEVMVSYSFNHKFSKFLDYAGHYALNIGLFYFNSNVALAHYFKGGKRPLIKVLFNVLLEIVLYIFLKYLLYISFLHLNIYSSSKILSSNLFLTESIWRAIYFIGLSTGYWFFLSMIKQMEELSAMEKIDLLRIVENKELNEKLMEANNSFLKAQINPHFLFNVLGFIHSLVIKYSDDAAETIVLLSDMMRYALDQPKIEGKTLLKDEIQHVKNYILINQYRCNNQLHLEFNIEGDVENIYILPLIFMTIVENIFKYGDLTNADNPARISVVVAEAEIIFSVYNKIGRRSTQISNRIGMSNVVKRLEQHYKDKYNLKIDNLDQEYLLNLILEI